MKKRFFPWRLYRNFLITLVILLNSMNFLTLIVGSYVFNFEFFTFDNFLFSSAFFLFSLVGSAYVAYRFALPLRRVILKALRMANKKLFFEISEEIKGREEDLFESETGEYFELEQALDQIRKKLRKRREQLAHEREETQALVSSIEDGVVSIGPDGRILYFNAGFANHFLNREQLNHANENPFLLTQALRDSEILELFDSALKLGLGGSLQKAIMTLLDGSERIFSVTVNPLRDPKTKEIFGAMGIFHDITEMKLAEKIRIEFVENASHELRTPLTSIKGYLSTLNEDFHAGKLDQVGQFLSIITKNVDRLGELVNDLLTISSLEHGAQFEQEAIYPDQLTSDVIDKISKQASEKNILMKFQVNGVDEILGDRGKMEQVLTNLIGNAIKYTQSGGRVEVFWEKSSDGGSILLRVKDNGPGIAKEHHGRLFERFYRVDKARSREVGGTGLGLSIVKHIMQSHGGQVSVKSDMGLGTEFICQFPMRN